MSQKSRSEAAAKGSEHPVAPLQGDIPPQQAAEKEAGGRRDVPGRWSAVKCSRS